MTGQRKLLIFEDNEQQQLLLIRKLNVQSLIALSRLELLLLVTSAFEDAANTTLSKVCVYNKCSVFQIINDPSTAAVAVKKGICHLAVNHYITKVAPKRR